MDAKSDSTSPHLDAATFLRYSEDALAPDERAGVEQHLNACGTCQAELALTRGWEATPVGARDEQHSDRLRASFAAALDARLGESTHESDDGEPADGVDGVDAVQATSKPRPSPERRAPVRGAPAAPRPSRWRSAALMAAAVAAIAVGVVQIAQRSGPDDLGTTFRATPDAAPLGLSLSATPEGWSADWTVRGNLRTVRLKVVNATGEVLLEQSLADPPFAVDRGLLPPMDASEAELLFGQLYAIDELGNEVRSDPIRLP